MGAWHLGKGQFTNARVLTMDPLIGTVTGADVLLVGALLVGVGPGVVTAAGDDNAIDAANAPST
ncbi:hypothetical protein N7U49_39095 [Streptomyces sp. AD2-2]|nr:hypothetical protein N7U49_39095 [Streptomyces sp. AD2-2]